MIQQGIFNLDRYVIIFDCDIVRMVSLVYSHCLIFIYYDDYYKVMRSYVNYKIIFHNFIVFNFDCGYY